jgi:hypothetical protein
MQLHSPKSLAISAAAVWELKPTALPSITRKAVPSYQLPGIKVKIEPWKKKYCFCSMCVTSAPL